MPGLCYYEHQWPELVGTHDAHGTDMAQSWHSDAMCDACVTHWLGATFQLSQAQKFGME